MNINNAGLKLIKSYEGCSLKAYKLSGEKYYTIGYGHSFDNNINASTVWTQAKADTMLKKDLIPFENSVTEYAKKYGFTFSANEFSALVSYTYNRGAGGLKELFSNSKSISQVSKNIVVYWGSAEKYKNGLVKRRKAEKELFDKKVAKKPTKAVTPSSESSYIVWVQKKLDITADGIYGANTKKAVLDYKKKNKLKSTNDSSVGLTMIKKLAS